jgi:hypothetical protein
MKVNKDNSTNSSNPVASSDAATSGCKRSGFVVSQTKIELPTAEKSKIGTHSSWRVHIYFGGFEIVLYLIIVYLINVTN